MIIVQVMSAGYVIDEHQFDSSRVGERDAQDFADEKQDEGFRVRIFETDDAELA